MCMTHETDWVGPGNKSFSITQGKEGGGGGGGQGRRILVMSR